MIRIITKRGVAAFVASTVGLAALASGTAGASNPGAVTRTFSFIQKSNSKTLTLVNIDSLLMNARCDSRGNPVIFGFSSASNADLLGRIFDGFGRLHIVKNTSFTSKSKGVSLATSNGDFDATGVVLFETSDGKVVTVNYAFDNSTTLSGLKVCTVYGSVIAT